MGQLSPSPDVPLVCLLVQPASSTANFWTFAESARAMGARTNAPPLGLMTVAALLPQQWSFRLVDLNVRPLTPADWEGVDVACVGGMLPHQQGILQIIREARRRGCFVVVGGPDPTSQPDLYREADARVLGEGEVSIPRWLASWRAGDPRGLFVNGGWADVRCSPVPRFDLIDFRAYIQMSVQFSRGCPLTCEFCDIIELFGRAPRLKTADQVLRELDHLHALGFRGCVSLVDDNFIGNRREVKGLLRALVAWGDRKRHPFVFATQASMNVADDPELLDLMRQAGFRFVFLGIETPDMDVLVRSHKRINSLRPIADRVGRLHDHGMAVTAGLIMGFDGESAGADRSLIACIEQAGIVVAMVGLLFALPRTALFRRLQAEGRLLASTAEGVPVVNVGGADQTIAGLNFVTDRPRAEILREYRNVIQTLYDARSFMDRVMAATARLKPAGRRGSSWFETKRNALGFFRTAWWMTRRRDVRRYYWRNLFRSLLMGREKFEFAQIMAGSYLHLATQSRQVLQALAERLASETGAHGRPAGEATSGC